VALNNEFGGFCVAGNTDYSVQTMNCADDRLHCVSFISRKRCVMAIHNDFLLAHNEEFVMSEELVGLQVMARCGECIGASAPEIDEAGNKLTSEQAANLQWVRCGQCRCGTHDWNKRIGNSTV